MAHLPRELIAQIGSDLTGSDLTTFLNTLASATGRVNLLTKSNTTLTAREVFNPQLYDYPNDVDFVVTTWGVHTIPIVAVYSGTANGQFNGPVRYLSRLLPPDTVPTQVDLVATGWHRDGVRVGQWVITGKVMTWYVSPVFEDPLIEVQYYVTETGEVANGQPTGLWHAVYRTAPDGPPVINAYDMFPAGLAYKAATWWELPAAAQHDPTKALAVHAPGATYSPVVKMYGNRFQFELFAAELNAVVTTIEYSKDTLDEWAVSGYGAGPDVDTVFSEQPRIPTYDELFGAETLAWAVFTQAHPANLAYATHNWFYPSLVNAPFSPLRGTTHETASLVPVNYYQNTDTTGRTVIWRVTNGQAEVYATGRLDARGDPSGWWRFSTTLVDGTVVTEYGYLNYHGPEGRWRVMLTTNGTQYTYELTLDQEGTPNGTVWVCITDTATNSTTATGLGLFDFATVRGTWVLSSIQGTSLRYYAEQPGNATALVAQLDITYGLAPGLGGQLTLTDTTTYTESGRVVIDRVTQLNPAVVRLPFSWV